MKRRLIFGVVAAALALNLAIGAAIYLNPARATEQKDSMDANLDLFANVLQKVRAEYVDGTNLTYRNLTDAAIRGHDRLARPAQRIPRRARITSSCRTTRKASSADSASSLR